MEIPPTVRAHAAAATLEATSRPCALVTGSGALVPPELAGTVGVVDLPVRIGEQEIDFGLLPPN